jgi:hypothetical protein
MANNDPMCSVCKCRKSSHQERGTPLRLWCPPRQTEFSACVHPRSQGSMGMSHDGKNGWSDCTCMDCGERIVSGNPPGYSQADASANCLRSGPGPDTVKSQLKQET